MGATNSWAIYAVCIASHIVGLCLFLKGFFPSKVVLPGHNEFFTEPNSPFIQRNGHAQFDKVIVMVVDAMRADFLFSQSRSKMPFVHSLIEANSALPFTAFSTPPTVTLPRLKGITTGGTPNFLDAILNVADDKDDSQGLSNQDSWVHQFKYHGNANRKLHFYGDDTWLKLFPPDEYFEQFDGTNSFFVSDFTEVDNNVTRHLDTDLSKSANWDALILHYLGLDHIGHKGGPDSTFMGPKQKEMNDIIERLYSYITSTTSQNTLLVVMGDHGMNEIGNHGGSSSGETSPGLLLVSPKFQKVAQNLKSPLSEDPGYQYYDRVNQIDLVPTLATLLNFPIPMNNLGIVMKNILDLWTTNKEKHAILLENCQQFKRLVEAKYTNNDPEYLEMISKWNKLIQLKTDSSEFDIYYDFLLEVQNVLSSSATSYNYFDIWCGFAILLLSSITVWGFDTWYYLRETKLSRSSIIITQGAMVLYSLHFHGSSLIEEEHQIWWFLSISFLSLMFSFTRFKSVKWFIVLGFSMRIIRSWNNSGQKFSTPFTAASYLLKNGNVLWILNAITYLALSFQIYNQGSLITCLSTSPVNSFKERLMDVGGVTAFVLTYVFCSLSFSFKLCQFYNDGNSDLLPQWALQLVTYTCESYGLDMLSSDKNQFQEMSVQLSRLASLGIIALMITRVTVGKFRNIKFGLLTDLVNMSTLLLIHHTRCENIPVFLVFNVAKLSFAKILDNNKRDREGNIDYLILLVTSFTLCLQNLSFFSIGNTNSLATVDLSNAYNGVKSYDVFLVGLLTFISNYAVVIFWSFSSLQLIFEDSLIHYSMKPKENLVNYPYNFKRKILVIKSFLTLTFYALSVVNLVGSCINLRFHLFIWTVFSPKLLYFASWSVLVNGLVDFIVAILLLSVT